MVCVRYGTSPFVVDMLLSGMDPSCTTATKPSRRHFHSRIPVDVIEVCSSLPLYLLSLRNIAMPSECSALSLPGLVEHHRHHVARNVFLTVTEHFPASRCIRGSLKTRQSCF